MVEFKMGFIFYGLLCAAMGGIVATYIAVQNVSELQEEIQSRLEERQERTRWENQTTAIKRGCDEIVEDAIIRMKVVKAFESALENHIQKTQTEEEA